MQYNSRNRLFIFKNEFIDLIINELIYIKHCIPI